MTHPAETARALGLSTVVTGVRLPFCAMNAAGTGITMTVAWSVTEPVAVNAFAVIVTVSRWFPAVNTPAASTGC